MPISDKNPLVAAIMSFVENVPVSEAEHIILRLSSDGKEKMKGHLTALARTSRTEHLYRALDDAWNANLVGADALALSIDVSMKTARTIQAKQEVSTVWTGPATEVVPLRRTEQVLCEIIDAAKETLLVVSFVAYRADDVLSAIKRALLRKVSVMMILETEKESGGKVSFDQAAKYKLDFPGLELYTWPLEKREKDAHGHFGAIHAKCAVADRSVAFVTSANLTEFALELNMELGLLVRGESVPASLQDHFGALISRGILKRL